MTTSTPSPSTVGRGRRGIMQSGVVGDPTPHRLIVDDLIDVRLGDALAWYPFWPAPDVIVSDGAYGVLGFEGDTSDHLGIPEWYEPHVRAWAEHAKPGTTLWFWNSEIGWASAHPVLERHGFRYVQANVWDKGVAHIAGNVNTAKIRRFPVVTEVCVQYAFEAKYGPACNRMTLKDWLRHEWGRAELTLKQADEACGTKNVASRKYLTKDHLWYWPPVEMFAKLRDYANANAPRRELFGPYFSIDGRRPMTNEEWAATRSKFHCPHGVTNVWDRPALHGAERVKVPAARGAAHLNQKPLDLLERVIRASSDMGDVVWEPFGGLFSASLATARLGRRAFGAEINPMYFQIGVERLKRELRK